jgi:excisionase family DNA binding protein
MSRLLSIDETAERLHVQRCTIRNLRQAGRFAPAVKIGRRLFWDEADLEEWLRQQKESA